MAKASGIPDSYVGLDFSLPDMVLELRHLRALAAGFLDLAHGDALKSLEDDLGRIGDCAPTGSVPWMIPEARPLRTRLSDGRYEPGTRTGIESVYAEISGCWTLQVPKQPKRHIIRVVELASIAVKLSTLDNQVVAEWHFDIADAAGPGCHFHTQIRHLGHSSISVPRLPTLFVTPADIVDFTLGELFQEDWQRRVSTEKPEAQGWRRLQNGRLTKLLAWHQGQLRAGHLGWAHLKRQKPAAGILLCRR